MKECVTDDRQCRQAIVINCILDAVKWRQRTSLSDAKDDDKSRQKRRKIDVIRTPTSGAKKVDKVDIKRTTKGRQKGRPLCCLNIKDSPLLPCLIVYSLKQKRERVAHCLSVFIIVIIYFDNFDMIL